MLKSALFLSATPLLALAACSKAPDATNVADANNSAGAALENSAAELDATTDNLTETEVGNIEAESNVATAREGNTAAK